MLLLEVSFLLLAVLLLACIGVVVDMEVETGDRHEPMSTEAIASCHAFLLLALLFGVLAYDTTALQLWA